jgi:hypothetical protein
MKQNNVMLHDGCENISWSFASCCIKNIRFFQVLFLSLNIAFVFPPSRQQYIIGVKYFENLFDVNLKTII